MRRRARAIGAVAGALLVLSGCATDSPDTATPSAPADGSCAFAPGAVGFVVGGRANSPGIGGPSTPPVLVASTQAAVANQASTLLVDTGGSPHVSVVPLALTANNDAAREQEQAAKVVELQDAILATTATAEEADPLEALNLAADHLRSNGGTGTIVLVDSGLQTTGALDYTKPGMLSATPGDVAASLKASGHLPDLRGVTVLLVGIGSTAAPQEALDTATRHNVQEQWRAIAQAAGATCTSVDTTPTTNPAAAGLPTVTPVVVPPVQAAIPTPDDPSELALQFQSNSAQFVDPAGAEQSLAPLGTWLAQSGTQVLLTGTTASDGTEEGRAQLSLMRAEAVGAALVRLGAHAEQITTEGVGTDHPSHVDDLGPDGELLPGPAARNRLVIVSVQG